MKGLTEKDFADLTSIDEVDYEIRNMKHRINIGYPKNVLTELAAVVKSKF
jgi:hypothetical protein